MATSQPIKGTGCSSTTSTLAGWSLPHATIRCGQPPHGAALTTGRVSQGVALTTGRVTPGIPGVPGIPRVPGLIEQLPPLNPGLTSAPNPF
jgi:hypothetical protein